MEAALATFVFTFIFGQVFAISTFGAAELAEAATATAIAARITRIVTLMIEDAEKAASIVSTISTSLAKVLIEGISSGANAALDVGVTDAVNLAFGKDPESYKQVENDILNGGYAGLVAELFKIDTKGATARLARWADETKEADSATSKQLKTSSRNWRGTITS